ncbi:MAG: hypothetical protein Q8O52_01645 [Sulfuritalea sp.]|nr:hypothetical protein [Sulfuritalea sp.]
MQLGFGLVQNPSVTVLDPGRRSIPQGAIFELRAASRIESLGRDFGHADKA